jgi:hypothetical protein
VSVPLRLRHPATEAVDALSGKALPRRHAQPPDVLTVFISCFCHACCQNVLHSHLCVRIVRSVTYGLSFPSDRPLHVMYSPPGASRYSEYRMHYMLKPPGVSEAEVTATAPRLTKMDEKVPTPYAAVSSKHSVVSSRGCYSR